VVINDAQMSNIVYSIAHKRSASVVAKAIMSSSLREAVEDEILKKLDGECRTVCRNNQSCLQQHGYTDVIDIAWHEVLSEWQLLAPLFLRILLTVLKANNKHADKVECLAGFIGSSLLFGRCQRMSRVQYMIGVMLDNCGVTNEVSFSVSATVCVTRYFICIRKYDA
jgi:hypothetical protein